MKVLRTTLIALCVTLGVSAGGPAPGAAAGWDTYGGSVILERTTALGRVLHDRRARGKVVLTRGSVVDVCQKKGCWMTVASGRDTVRVEFQDYGFFVPWGVEGKPVRMEGVLREKILSPEEQAHLAAESRRAFAGRPRSGDAGKFLVFVATAVEILGGGPIGAEQRQVLEGNGSAH